MTDYTKWAFENHETLFESCMEDMRRMRRRNHNVFIGIGLIAMMGAYHEWSEKYYCASWLYNDRGEHDGEFINYLVNETIKNINTIKETKD